MTTWRVALLSFAALALASCSHPSAGPPPDARVIEFDPNLGTDADGRNPAWLAYGTARRIWIDSVFFEKNPGERRYRYTYEEEVYARESMAQIWSELREEHGFQDPYLLELAEVERAGFIREYVWACLAFPSWGEPSDLRLPAFDAWQREHIPDHRAETRVSVREVDGNITVSVGPAAHEPTPCRTY